MTRRLPYNSREQQNEICGVGNSPQRLPKSSTSRCYFYLVKLEGPSANDSGGGNQVNFISTRSGCPITRRLPYNSHEQQNEICGGE
ncbi:hypothetical protein CDAR_592491 [Caerostris darwini]|uniref:Uncharacterized protein n=1 Tax=Caerostris darwini TaxID=1538125 RepID=A0AAV4TWW3_9ARAC|nr:hypothetical protein CDAR_592491 [Caerostris darwini]